MIKVKDLHYTYPNSDKEILRGINVDILPGEWVAVIGVNGSGKSSFARCLNGLLTPSQGSVIVDELDTADAENLWQLRAKLAFMFQNPDNQFIGASVEEDIAFGPENLGFPREEISRCVEEALKVTKLEHLRNKPPHLLSGGEKQQVALATAVAMDADYMVLDEPTSMLNPAMRKQILDILQSMHKKGTTLIYVTNIISEALLAQRVLVMANGRIIRDCTPKELLADSQFLLEQQLELPQICRIAALLADAGYEQLRGATSIEEITEILCG